MDNQTKGSSMLQAINYASPDQTSTTVPTTTVPTTTSTSSFLTPRNIMIGTGVICILIVLTKSK